MGRADQVGQPERGAGEELGLVDGLVQLSFLIQEVFGRVAASHKMTPIQVRLLGILRDRAPTMLELARFLKLDKSTVSGLIARAERRGLVVRTPSSVDGRVIHVTLTPDGQRLAEVGVEEISRQVNALASRLPATARAQLAALATQLVRNDASGRGFDLAADKTLP